jgi:hypothetical protein
MSFRRYPHAVNEDRPLLVHVRPNGPYLLVVAAALVGVAFGVTTMLRGGAGPEILGAVALAGSAVVLVLLGAPIVLSTLFRVPALVADGDGIRLPLMGVRLTWPEVRSVNTLMQIAGRPRPAVLIVPADPRGVVRQTRPWLRREAEANITRHGTPLVVVAASLNRSADEIAAAINLRRRAVDA